MVCLWSQPFLLSSRYNPECDSESRLLRHRAVALQDMAHTFLDHELNEEFDKVGGWLILASSGGVIVCLS